MTQVPAAIAQARFEREPGEAGPVLSPATVLEVLGRWGEFMLAGLG